MKTKLSVLVACEFSGVVREAFRERGWDAWSVDLLPSEIPGKHIVGDAVKALTRAKWDLLVSHPPCTFLCNSGAKHLYEGMKKENGRNFERWNRMQEAAEFFNRFLFAPIPHIAVENPVMVGHAQKLIGEGPAFSVQPWEHGHPEVKRTCFWTRNLPPLTPTNIVEGREPRVHFCSPGPDRWKERSRTLPGLAHAMASQWGSFIEKKFGI